ncbi:MAG: hypothetical protein M0R40_03725 [Firmicutes bacterium]|nr:hypothetical protein [Bacillota bacterium]
MQQNNLPEYWRTELDDIDATLANIKKGVAKEVCKSPGGRAVHKVFYGKKNNLGRTANLSSALGAKDINCYGDKTQEDYRPTLFLVGCVHGGEFEGTAALLNLINIIEKGVDFAGKPNSFFEKIINSVNFIIIPCANPDGRARVPFESMVGKSYEQLRYYNQGTWRDGTLCGWPGCKKVHPMKRESVGFLGGYFNDDGINLMHDDFFLKSANETETLLKTADRYAPDFTILLHGGANSVNHILKPAYAPEHIKERILLLEQKLEKRCNAAGAFFKVSPLDRYENRIPPASFNLTSALYHISGMPSITYETNQGLSYGELRLSHEDIYRQHMFLFEETCKLIMGGDKFEY